MIRCLCSCLIRKNTVTYSEVNDEKHKFMSVSDHLEDDHRHEPVPPPDLPSQLSNSINNYFQEQTAPELPPQPPPESEAHDPVELMAS